MSTRMLTLGLILGIKLVDERRQAPWDIPEDSWSQHETDQGQQAFYIYHK